MTQVTVLKLHYRNKIKVSSRHQNVDYFIALTVITNDFKTKFLIRKLCETRFERC